MADAFRLTVPPDTAHISTIRIFVVSAGRTLGFDEDQVGDLKLAASELATAALPSGATIEITLDEEALRVSPAPANHDSDDLLDPLNIVGALFPGTEIYERTVLVPTRSET